MNRKVSGNSISVKLSQPAKAQDDMFSTFLPKVTSCNFAQSINALDSIDIRLSGSLTVRNDLNVEKANSFNFVTPSGMESEVSLSLGVNAPSAIILTVPSVGISRGLHPAISVPVDSSIIQSFCAT